MKVVRAKVLGFCKGVSRAVELARQVSFESGDRPVYTLGPLIHNTQVLESLEGLGIICLNEGEIPASAENAAIIIRAHGIPPKLESDITRRGIGIVDATCPHVKISQSKARQFAERGYVLFLAGEEKHAEIEGLRGYAEDVSGLPLPRCFVVSNPFDAEAAAEKLCRLEPQAKTALLGQTTMRAEEYRAIGDKILQFFPSVEITDSICGATAERQNALRELCAGVDALIIAGSRESANTQRLLSLAKESGRPAWLAETRADIPAEIEIYTTVGISAGASTPDSLINEIEETLTAI